jgi:hypothetical protein
VDDCSVLGFCGGPSCSAAGRVGARCWRAHARIHGCCWGSVRVDKQNPAYAVELDCRHVASIDFRCNRSLAIDMRTVPAERGPSLLVNWAGCAATPTSAANLAQTTNGSTLTQRQPGIDRSTPALNTSGLLHQAYQPRTQQCTVRLPDPAKKGISRLEQCRQGGLLTAVWAGAGQDNVLLVGPQGWRHTVGSQATASATT